MKATDKLSKYCSYGEATKSDAAVRKGIDNTPNESQIEAMKYVASEIFDKVREFAGGPVHINSFYRSPELNAAIGGAKLSQHMKGEAIDIDCDQFGNSENELIFKFVKDNLEFDQLIWEFGTEKRPDWIHVSKVQNKKNRMDVKRAYKTASGDTQYVEFDLQNQ